MAAEESWTPERFRTPLGPGTRPTAADADPTAPPPATVRPGALTALLVDLVRVEPGAGWDVPLMPPEVVGGRFEIQRELGRGGFGIVYEARDRELGRAVAFKAVHSPLGDALGPRRVTGEMLAEAEAAAQLAHPNIVYLYDVGRDDRGAYLIMELLRGVTLTERIARGGLTVREVVHLAIEVARGLAHSHAHGVVHRDLKPGNVFLCDDGQVKLLDFGMAHVFGRRGPVGGTPGYMAPEQERGEAGDARADVYSLGVIMREMLGRRPANPPGELRRMPAVLSGVLVRMIAPDPAARPADGAAALAALLAVQHRLEPRRLSWAAWSLASLAMIVSAWALLRQPRTLPPGRLLVAMADTVNTTGDPDLEGVGTLLGSALEQSRRLSLLARSRLFGWAEKTGGTRPSRVDERIATEAGHQLSAQAVIVPAVRRTGQGLDVELKAIELSRGEALFTIREHAASKGVLPGALDRLSVRARAELGEAAAEAPVEAVPVSSLAPANPEALRHYVAAKRLDSEARFEDARREYERALAADPDFPLAHAELAVRAFGLEPVASEAHFEAALRHADRLPPKDRALLEARRFEMSGRPDDALAQWDRVIAGWPQDPTAYALAGFTLLQWYPDAAAARPYLAKALELAALEPGDAIEALEALGRLDEALERARRWVESSPGPGTFANLAFIHRVRGERAEALDAARRVVSYGYLPGGGILAEHRSAKAFWSYVEADAVDEIDEAYRSRGVRSWETLLLRGRVREAMRALDEDLARAERRPGWQPYLRHGIRGDLLAWIGDADGAWHELEQELVLGSGRVMCSFPVLVALGELDRPAQLMGVWAHSTAANPRLYCPRLYRHVREWKEGHTESAARGLAGMFGPEPAYHLGVIFAELGRDREAVEALRRSRLHPEFNFEGANLVAWPRSLYLEAAALERTGERGEALRTIERLLKLWERADPDLTHLTAARALRARLAAGLP